MIHPERLKVLNDKPLNKNGRYVLYWMQQSQRTVDNHALEYAAGEAAALGVPLIVWFGISAFPDANVRHYHFMFQGLRDVAVDLARRNIQFIVEAADPGSGAAAAGSGAALVVTDAGYLRIQREWRTRASEGLSCPLVQVESDVIVPVESVSEKEEYAAATIRKKIYRRALEFLKPFYTQKEVLQPGRTENGKIDIPSAGKGIKIKTFDDAAASLLLKELGVDASVEPVDWIRGGQIEARNRLGLFLKERLHLYDSLRNDPSREAQSDLSPFLHFGQISPLTICLRLLDHDAKSGRHPFSAAAAGVFRPEALSPGVQAYIEELVIRRELSANFCRYNPFYDSLKALPSWALETLAVHEKDDRKYTYTVKDLEEAKTHDPYWNAAAKQMYRFGKMHGYMRMYWGKKIIEWSKDTETAFSTMLYLNNKYFLDGRDINSFAGVAWCFGKHDRPWKEREIFGKIRYMNARGLERKFDIDKYVALFG